MKRPKRRLVLEAASTLDSIVVRVEKLRTTMIRRIDIWQVEDEALISRSFFRRVDTVAAALQVMNVPVFVGVPGLDSNEEAS